MKRLVVAMAALVLAPALAHAAQPQLALQQVEITKKNWPRGRAYANLVGASGTPIQGLGADLFRVYEDGNKTSSKILKVDTLDNVQAGASIVVVVQASGAMSPIKEDIKKAVAAFINGLGEKDQVAIVSYGENADTVSGFSEHSPPSKNE